MVLENPVAYLGKRNSRILIHTGLWMLLIFYEVFYVYMLNGRQPIRYLDSALGYALNISLFYTNVWCLNYSFTKKHNPYIYALLFIAESVLYLLIHFVLGNLTTHWSLPLSMFKSSSIYLRTSYRFVYFIGISTGYWFVLLLVRSNTLINKMQTRHLIQQKRSIELERNLFKTRNAYLTSQINPHLLFNTLNFIYSSLYEVSKKAAETVMLLSDMMRYSLTEVGEDGKVELAQEVEHIENMIQLNQARFDDNLNIKLYVNGEFEVRIIPLVLLTFIENIFKHGDLSDPENPARINISYYHNILEYYSVNKVRQRNINRGHGIGIENSRTRLDDAYAGNYTLSTTIEDGFYITHLTITFK